MKRLHSYNVFYKCGNLEIETSVEATNLTDAYIRAHQPLTDGTITPREGTICLATTRVERKNKKEKVSV